MVRCASHRVRNTTKNRCAVLKLVHNEHPAIARPLNRTLIDQRSRDIAPLHISRGRRHNRQCPNGTNSKGSQRPNGLNHKYSPVASYVEINYRRLSRLTVPIPISNAGQFAQVWRIFSNSAPTGGTATATCLASRPEPEGLPFWGKHHSWRAFILKRETRGREVHLARTPTPHLPVAVPLWLQDDLRTQCHGLDSPGLRLRVMPRAGRRTCGRYSDALCSPRAR